MCVLLALALTIWLAGPKAYEVLAARWHRSQGDGPGGPRVDLDLVSFGERPDWLRGPFLLTVARDLSPRLSEKVGLLDEVDARRVKTRLLASPGVKTVRLRQEHPDRFRVSLDLRRPVLEVEFPGARLLVDRHGVCLPPTRSSSGLPVAVLTGLPGYPAGGQPARIRMGMPHPDPVVRAAAAVAVEWRDEMVPLVPEAPPLVEVDTSNLDYRFIAAARVSEVRVGLRRGDGQIVYLAYGRPPGARLERLPVAAKAKILECILAHAPGLMGLQGGDLRFANRWRDWLLPRPGRLPDQAKGTRPDK
ncbi:MAG: hypothetical protein V3U11_01630 [Planctomycetota bacterium]